MLSSRNFMGFREKLKLVWRFFFLCVMINGPFEELSIFGDKYPLFRHSTTCTRWPSSSTYAVSCLNPRNVLNIRVFCVCFKSLHFFLAESLSCLKSLLGPFTSRTQLSGSFTKRLNDIWIRNCSHKPWKYIFWSGWFFIRDFLGNFWGHSGKLLNALERIWISSDR